MTKPTREDATLYMIRTRDLLAIQFPSLEWELNGLKITSHTRGDGVWQFDVTGHWYSWGLLVVHVSHPHDGVSRTLDLLDDVQPGVIKLDPRASSIDVIHRVRAIALSMRDAARLKSEAAALILDQP